MWYINYKTKIVSSDVWKKRAKEIGSNEPWKVDICKYNQAVGAAFRPPHLLFWQTKIATPPQLKAAPDK